MATDRRIRAALLAMTLLGGPAVAQAPLSAIDWLDSERQTRTAAPPPLSAPRDEPPVATSGTRPEVEVVPLGQPSADAVGLLPMSVTGLPPDLWARSEAATLGGLIRRVDLVVPAMSALMFTLLLAEADAPEGSGSGAPLLLARLDRLFAEGAIDPGLALIERARGDSSPELYTRWLDFALLSGGEEAPCLALKADPSLSADLAERIYCDARTGDWDHAVTVFGTARALGQIDGRDGEILARYLDPALSDGESAVSPPARPTPLEFRLFEAMGEALPTQPLPRPFAAYDLSGNSGWRAQVLAGERLARAGALSDNRLLGLYSDREPAASGGVWDRVEAVQDLEAAIASGRADLAGPALVRAWPQMRSAGLLVTFSRLFGSDLGTLALSGRAAEFAERAQLLSSDYETVARDMTPRTDLMRVIKAVATGSAPADIPEDPRLSAVARAWQDATVPDTLSDLRKAGKLGEVILRAMELYASGAEGNHADMTAALAAFRDVSLEDTARRAAIQFLILGDEGALR